MTGRRILVIDDDSALTALYRRLLEKIAGFIVHERNDGASALASARSLSPHLILLDCLLPDTSGLAVASALRNDPQLNAVPIVLVTGSVPRLGSTGKFFLNEFPLLPKPFSFDELLQMVREILAGETVAG